MNLLYITGAIYPSLSANCVQVMKMCSAFSKNQIKVKLFAGRNSDVSGGEIKKQYGIKEDFEIHMIRRFSIRFLGAILYSFLVLLNVLKNRKSIDVIYSRDPNSLGLTSVIGIPFLYEAHAEPGGFKFHVEKLLFKRGCFKGLIVISASLKRYYLESFPFLNESMILVAHDGADLIDKIEVAEGLDASMFKPDAFNVGYTGHLYEGKGIEMIVKLAPVMPYIQFHVIGGFSKDVQRWQSEFKFDNLHYHGYVDNYLLPNYLDKLDLLLLPPQNKVSGMGGGDIAKYMSPLKLFEYMAAKKPIVASNLNVLMEILVDRKNALVVDPSSVKDWKKAIDELKDDEQLRERLSTQAFAELKDRYTWVKRAEVISKNYLEKKHEF